MSEVKMMADYNWKSCADPVNAARLRELLEAGREVLMTWHRVGRPMREYFGVNPKDAELIASLLKERNLDVFSFLEPDEPQTATELLRKIVGNRVALWSYGGTEGKMHREVADRRLKQLFDEAKNWLQSEGINL